MRLMVFFLVPVMATGAGAETCVATQMGSPCPQGGIATMGAAVAAPDFGIGNPVDRRSGNKYQRDTDLPSLAQAPWLELVRHYNAFDPRRGPIGRGWSWSYDTRLYAVPPGVQVVQADGSRMDFDCGQGFVGTCGAHEPARGWIRKASDGWVWQWPQGTRLTFDARGWLVAITDRGRNVAQIQRHADGSALSGAIRSVVTYPHGARLQFEYDLSGPQAALTAVQTPIGDFRYEVRAHDGGALRLESVMRPDGMVRRYHHEPALQSGHSEALTGISIAESAQSPGFRTHTWLYRADGRADAFIPGDPASGWRGLPVSVDDAALGLESVRDRDGRLRGLGAPNRGWPGLKLAFDHQGRLSGWVARGLSGERASVSESGGLRERSFGTTGRWQWRVDRHDRVVSAHAADASQMIETRIDWRGMRPVRITHPNETLTLRYDRQGRLRARALFRPADPGAVPVELVDRFSYDDSGRRREHILPEGGRLHFAYAPGGRVRSIAWEDAQGERHPVINADGAGIRHGNGYLTTTIMSPRGLRGLLVYEPATRTAPFVQTRIYDAKGALRREDEIVAGVQWATAYSRDSESRMTGFQTWRISPETGRVDRVSRRALAWDSSGAAIGSWDGETADRPRHARGATGLPARVGEFITHYGAQRRLSLVQRIADPGFRVAYGHNAFGERIWRDTGAERRHYLHDAHQLAAEAQLRHGRMTVTRRYIYAHQLPVAMIHYSDAGPELLMIHADPLGLPRLVTDARKRIRWLGRFTPLGQLAESFGDLEMPLRLPGQVADPATGWHDNYQRTYDPAWGQYLEPDPLGPVPGNSLYGYADQQPRRYADPLGLMLFAFDGTGNRPESLTNVWLMAQAYRDGPVHYVPGPGTARTLSGAANASDVALAWSGMTRVDAQWERLLNALASHRRGDGSLPLDIVGFSRGAALGRDFGNRVARHVRAGRFWARHPLHGIVSECVDLRFMGLFDTVAQFNVLGAGNASFDLTIAPAWRWVAHAVALHERRWLFPLTSVVGGSNVIERPFVGAHADVGGGYLTTQASPGSTPGDLSHVALAWMAWQARAAGVAVAPAAEVQAVQSPIVHDERAVFSRRTQNSDRRVSRADGSPWARYQDDVPVMGSGLRREVESFVARRPHAALTGPDAVGFVDMGPYAQWLGRTMGLR